MKAACFDSLIFVILILLKNKTFIQTVKTERNILNINRMDSDYQMN